MLRILITMLFTAILILSIQAGVSWVNLGHGLHPIVAFPLATLSALSILGLIVLAHRLDK